MTKFRYSSSYARQLRSFTTSLLKFSKDDNEIRFFAKLFDQNIGCFEISAINKAISIIRKNFVDLSSKGDHNFRKVKVNIKDIMKYLQLIFSMFRLIQESKVKNYANINDTPLQNRVRDYIVDIQPAIVIETNGVEFLMIVEREAKLTAQHLSYRSTNAAEAVKKSLYQVNQDKNSSTENKPGMSIEMTTGKMPLKLPAAQMSPAPTTLKTEQVVKFKPSNFIGQAICQARTT